MCLAEREKDYVLAAKALGASGRRRLFRYVLPSVWQVIPVIALLDIGFLVIMESTLSFLGLGLPPSYPSWGGMLAEGRKNMTISPWLPILPGLAIMATVLSVNLAADGLADVLDPKLRTRSGRPAVQRTAVRDHVPSESTNPTLLQVEDLHVEFPLADRVVQAVRGVGFELSRGSTLGIVGESGSGKTRDRPLDHRAARFARKDHQWDDPLRRPRPHPAHRATDWPSCGDGRWR